MSHSIFRCSWKIFIKLSAPIRKIFKGFLILFMVEFFKFSAVLLIAYGFGYLIFHFVDANSLVDDIRSQRLSASLIQNGSFSKFPFVIELLPKASTDPVKKPSN